MSIRTRLARLEKKCGLTADTTWMLPVYESGNETRETVLAAYAHRKLPPLENIGFVPIGSPRPAVPDPAWPKRLDELSDETLERTIDWLDEGLKARGYEIDRDRAHLAYSNMTDAELLAVVTKRPVT